MEEAFHKRLRWNLTATNAQGWERAERGKALPVPAPISRGMSRVWHSSAPGQDPAALTWPEETLRPFIPHCSPSPWSLGGAHN